MGRLCFGTERYGVKSMICRTCPLYKPCSAIWFEKYYEEKEEEDYE